MRITKRPSSRASAACSADVELQSSLPFIACEAAPRAGVALFASAETSVVAADIAPPTIAAVEPARCAQALEVPPGATPAHRPAMSGITPTTTPGPALPTAEFDALDYPNVPRATEAELRRYARPRPRLFLPAENSVIWQEILERRQELADAVIGGGG